MTTSNTINKNVNRKTKKKTKASAKKWIAQIFKAKQAQNGGMVRRSLISIGAYASIFELEAEVRRRGFHMVITGDQAVIFCHQGNLSIAC
jgi:hypothetical protein